MHKIRTQNAFTLVELIVVIVLIAILAGVGAPIYTNITTHAEASKIKATLDNVRAAIEMTHGENVLTGINSWPSLADVQGAVLRDIKFPENPWVTTNKSTIVAVAANNRSVPGGSGWCYHAASATFWANTTADQTSTGAPANEW